VPATWRALHLCEPKLLAPLTLILSVFCGASSALLSSRRASSLGASQSYAFSSKLSF
jgi:hypothetical protein